MSDDLPPMKPRLDQHRARTLARSTRLLDNYGLVLILLIASFLMITGGDNPIWRVTLIPTLAGAVLATYHASSVKPRSMAIISVLVVAASLFAFVAVVAEDRLTSPWVLAPMCLLLLSAPAVILRRVLAHRTVTAETLLGAICAYVYLGIIFALFFALVDSIESAPFFAQGPASRPGQYTYFSFVTISTLGYGDLSPGTDLGQALAVVEAVTGSIYLVTLVARLVSMYGKKVVPADAASFDQTPEQ